MISAFTQEKFVSLKPKTTQHFKRSIVASRGVLTALTLVAARSASAQTTVPTPAPTPGQDFSVPASAFIVPSLGQPLFLSDLDGTNQTRENGTIIVRPAAPEANAFSTSLDYETWDSGVVQGFNRISGDRVTGIFNFVRGRENNTEIALTVPVQRVNIDGVGSSTGIGDVNVAFRKYFYDAADPNGITIIASLRGSISTGNETNALGLGRPTVGPSLSLYKPFGDKFMAYGGGGINFAFGSSLGFDLKSSGYGYFGGLFRPSDRFGFKAEFNFFNTAFDESYARIIAGPQFYFSENQFLQLNVRRELRAVGRPTAVSVGYSTQF